MTSAFERNLGKYAEVIVKVGLNLQPGQRLLIGPPIYIEMGVKLDVAPLVRLIAAKAYQAGARLVDVIWWDPELDLIRIQGAASDSLEEYPTWKLEGAVEAARAGDALLSIVSPDAALLAGRDQDRIAQDFKTKMKYAKPFMDLRGQRAMNYIRVTAPIQPWADKVFPDLPPGDRLDQFWETLFAVCRVKENDPVSAWESHIAGLKARRDYLNGRSYAGLNFTGPGTDLRMGLPVGHLWYAATMTTQSGIECTVNIPTEEVFTMPHVDEVDGVVTSTKTLATSRGDIEGLKLRFSGGKVVEASAEKGEEIIHAYLEMDPGARRLGEVALVPHSSPISQTGRLFYTSLFDENASCHLALGNAYKLCIEGGEGMSDDEFSAAGGNSSQLHLDFMIGSGEMDVDGILEDGSTEPVLRGGEWAFDVSEIVSSK